MNDKLLVIMGFGLLVGAVVYDSKGYRYVKCPKCGMGGKLKSGEPSPYFVDLGTQKVRPQSTVLSLAKSFENKRVIHCNNCGMNFNVEE